MSAQRDILLIGATGYTGKLIARYLATHPERDTFTVSLGARSQTKLDALFKSLGPDQTFEQVIVDVGNAAQVASAVQNHAVVIHAAGPYALYGTPVVEACIKAGKHYVDLTGESVWYREILDRFETEAIHQGSIIVPSCAFDSVPSDIVAYLGARTIHPRQVDTSWSAVQFETQVSGGSWATMCNMLDTVPRDKIAQSQKDWVLTSYKGTAGIPGRMVYRLPLPGKSKTLFGTIFVLARHNTSIVQRTVGTYFRDKSGGNPLYGPSFKYKEFLQTSTAFKARLAGISTTLIYSILALFPPLRNLIARFNPPGAGPSEDSLEKGHFSITNITTSTPDENNNRLLAKTEITGKGEAGYFLTSIMISEAALLLIPSKKPKETLTDFAKQGGILTPMAAFGDTLITKLRETGRFVIESKQVVE